MHWVSQVPYMHTLHSAEDCQQPEQSDKSADQTQKEIQDTLGQDVADDSQNVTQDASSACLASALVISLYAAINCFAHVADPAAIAA